jgi:hypothetical protein
MQVEMPGAHWDAPLTIIQIRRLWSLYWQNSSRPSLKRILSRTGLFKSPDYGGALSL